MQDNHEQGGATDEAGSTPTSNAQDKPTKDVRRGFLSSAMRDLSEEELDSPAARRFLIAEIQRLDTECDEGKSLSLSYNDLRVENAQLRERSKKSRAIEILSFVSTSAGAAGLGAAPSYISVAEVAGVGWVFAVVAAILVLTGIICRIFS